jgi:oxaloacetate decarboxylase alpha subunit
VKAGEPVVIMEAMKMETEVRAQFPGTVTQIAVKEGDSVLAGDTLVLLA